ncbi:MAG: hypothetical protein KDC98_03830 [Planctomycetes bacterium]|nr:hypothetical protein [Planctomycetota bacterium]
MRLNWSRSVSALAICAFANGCVSHVHTVGLGAAGTETRVERQYYWLFGFVDVNEVDAQRMAGNLTSYTIETGYGLTDFLLTPLLLPLLATSRTVTVRT